MSGTNADLIATRTCRTHLRPAHAPISVDMVAVQLQGKRGNETCCCTFRRDPRATDQIIARQADAYPSHSRGDDFFHSALRAHPLRPTDLKSVRLADASLSILNYVIPKVGPREPSQAPRMVQGCPTRAFRRPKSAPGWAKSFHEALGRAGRS